MIIKYADIREDVARLRSDGLPTGKSTGWDKVDEHFRPEEGFMSILTGIPGHGKSEFMDCLICNTIWLHEWRWAIFSPENYPMALHFNKLAEKFMGVQQSLASEKDYRMATDIIDEYVTWIYPDQDDCTLDELLACVKNIKDAYGLSAFVLDPWNEISHLRPEKQTETEYISHSLTKFRRFCRREELYGTIVAHPTKVAPDKNGKININLWSISGSAAWRNKADYGLVVRRDDMTKNEPILSVQKIKQKNFGKPGEVQLFYDYKSGRMKDNTREPGVWRMPKR